MDARYPIGKFQKLLTIGAEMIQQSILDIEQFPQKLSQEVAGLTEAQLDTPYREGGWTIRQVVHHCADSHANGYIRFRLALTEQEPVIKPYLEAAWAMQADYALPLANSLRMIEGIHARWTVLLRNMSSDDWTKTYFHPDHKRTFALQESVMSYSWHGRHHLGHIQVAKKLF